MLFTQVVPNTFASSVFHVELTQRWIIRRQQAIRCTPATPEKKCAKGEARKTIPARTMPYLISRTMAHLRGLICQS